MKLQLLLLADYASVSSDNKLNVMGIFSSINATNFPAKHSLMYLVLSLVAELGETGQVRDVVVKMLDADGKELLSIAGKAELPESNDGPGMPEVNMILQLRDVPLIKPGPFMFVVIVDKDHKGQLLLQVNQVPPA